MARPSFPHRRHQDRLRRRQLPLQGQDLAQRNRERGTTLAGGPLRFGEAAGLGQCPNPRRRALVLGRRRSGGLAVREGQGERERGEADEAPAGRLTAREGGQMPANDVFHFLCFHRMHRNDFGFHTCFSLPEEMHRYFRSISSSRCGRWA